MRISRRSRRQDRKSVRCLTISPAQWYNFSEVKRMNPEKKVSIAVVKRLPRYYRYLSDLLKAGVTRVSSRQLSEKMGITASQIRQDFNCFGGFGQQGYGYNVEILFNEIKNILGLDKDRKMIIIGAGNIGRALANYENFKKRGFTVIGMFDVNPKVIGSRIKGIEVMSMERLEEFVKRHSVDIAILSVPYDQTRALAENLVKLGIKAIWNFSPMDLELPHQVVIENVHLSDSLMVLSYKLEHVHEI